MHEQKGGQTYLKVMINIYNQFSTLRLFIKLKCWSAVKTVSP